MTGIFQPNFLNQFSRIRHFHLEKFLIKHGHLLKWKARESVIDVGCGTGDLSYNCIYPLLPKDFSRFLCTDLSMTMVKEAEKMFQGTSKVFFEQLDLSGELTDDKKNAFDHVISLYCIMWIKNQRKAFENIYNLLSPSGGCFLVLVDKLILIDTFIQILEKPRWKKFVPNPLEMYPHPYMRDPDTIKTIREIMTSIGFVNIEVHLEESNFLFNSKEEFLGFLKGLPNPLPLMTPGEQEDYLRDAAELAYANKLIHESGHGDEVNGTFLVVYGEKANTPILCTSK